jgi:hypothetical protein
MCDESETITDFLYLPIVKETHIFYAKKLSFCCDRVQEHFNFSGPSKDDFLSHVKITEMVDGPPYIYLTGSPG